MNGSNRESNGAQTEQPTPRDVVVLVMGSMIYLILAGGVLRDSLGMWSYFASEIGLLAGVVLYLGSRRVNVVTALRLNPVSIALVPGIILIACGGAVLMDGLDRVILKFLPMPPEAAKSLVENFTAADPLSFVALALGIAVAAPLAEEAMFRGAIQQVLERNRDAASGVLTASLLFALMHIEPWWMVQLLILAIVVGYLAWRWDSILPGVALHAVQNFWTLILINRDNGAGLQGYLWRGFVNPIVLGAGLFLFIGGWVWLERMHLRLHKPIDGGEVDLLA